MRATMPLTFEAAFWAHSLSAIILLLREPSCFAS